MAKKGSKKLGKCSTKCSKKHGVTGKRNRKACMKKCFSK